MTDRLLRSKLSIASIAILVVAAATVFFFATANSSVEATEEAKVEEGTAEVQAEEAEDEGEAPIPVEVAEIVSGPIASYISATANLVPEDQVTVLAEAEGRVASINVEEGDRVEKGQVLASLIRDEAEIALNKAQLRAANTRLAFERAQDTAEQGLISAEAFDTLKMEYDVARQEVAEAEWRLGKTVIRAPFAGTVTERLVTLGQHLRHGDQLFTVADFSPLVARIYLPERDVMELHEGREVRVALAAADITFGARIRQISPVVDTATGTVKVTIEAIRPPAQVRPGAFVDIHIVREQKTDVVLLPRESVIRELRATHVYLADGGMAVKRAVVLGLEEGEVVEAISGVAAGEQVIVAGQGGLDEGQKVKIL